jgi:hypothetical protein
MTQNTTLTISDITYEGLMVLENEMCVANQVNRDYDDKFAIDGAKIGNTVNARRPARFKGSTGPALNIEAFTEGSTPVTLTTQFHVDTQFSTSDMLLSMDNFSKRVLQPAIATIANRVDYDLALMAKNNTFNITGTPGTAPSTVAPFLQAGAWLDSEAAPRDGNRSVILDQWSMASMAGALTGLFNPQVKISQQYEKGLLGKNTLGLNWMQDQNVPTHTFGAGGGTPLFDAAGTSSAIITTGWAASGTIATKGWTNSTAVVNVGDIVSLAGVGAVNPQNRQAVAGKPRYFVVLPPNGALETGTFAAVTDSAGVVVGGTYTSNGSGKVQLTVGNACIVSDAFQNATAAPAANAAITLFGGAGVASPQSLAFHRDAFTLVSADLPLPGGVDMAARASHKDIGMSLRVVRQYTINNDALPTRIDVLYGCAPLYRELSCRVAG